MTQPDKKKKKLGPSLNLAEEALEEAAQVTGVDIAAARTAWYAAVPKKWGGLIDALPIEPIPPEVEPQGTPGG